MGLRPLYLENLDDDQILYGRAISYLLEFTFIWDGNSEYGKSMRVQFNESIGEPNKNATTWLRQIFPDKLVIGARLDTSQGTVGD
jgi:hypothetical protein